MFEDIFRHKKAIVAKLKAYGFRRSCGVFRYDRDILNGEFHLEIILGKHPVPETRVTENATGEEYVLYRTDAVGSYVGAVRAAVTAVLGEIADQCCETALFTARQSAELMAYVRENYGDELEFLWEKFPDCAVWRRRDSRKWYAVLLTVSRRKLGLPSDDRAEILDLRCDPELLQQRIDNRFYFPGWHMNKKHWYTIILDGSVPLERICRHIDESYLLAI